MHDKHCISEKNGQKMALVLAPAKKKPNPQQPIKVVCRIRPFSEQEHAEKIRNILTVDGNTVIRTKDKRYQFDRVFRSDSTQMDIYLYVVSPMINDVLSGYNCTVFAYGQTGTGKTFTMTGGDRDFVVNNWREDPLAGCIPRAAANIFDQITSMGTATDYNVRVSFLELYNEEVRDLLSDDERPPPLNVLSDTKGTVCIQGLREITVNNRTDIFELLDKGTAKRQTAATLMNHHSSRSHTVFTITVHARETSMTGEDVLKTGKINLVDLAGSENIAKSGAKDQRALELANINKSLLTLGRVIQNLVDKVKHVPYRDSKLTRILQDSLGGHTKTCIIATVSGAHTSSEETVSTLDYASRARDIKNYPTVNEKFTKAQMMKEMNKEIEKLKKDLEAARSGQGFYVDKDNWEHMQNVYATVQVSNQEKQERIVSLEERISEMEEVMIQKARNFDVAVEDSKKFKSICAKQDVVIKRQKLVIDREKFIADVYKETAEKKGEECHWLITQYNDIQRDYFTLVNKVDSLYEINKTNETLLKDTLKRFTETTMKISDMSGKYLELSNRTAEESKMKREKLEAEHNRYDEFVKVAKESYDRLLEPFQTIDSILAAEDSPISNYCSRTQAQCDNDSLILETVQKKLEQHQSFVGDLLESLTQGVNDNIDDLKRQFDNQFKELEESKRKSIEEQEKFAEYFEETLSDIMEKFRKMRETNKRQGEANIQQANTLSFNIGYALDQLRETTVATATNITASISEDLEPVVENVKDVNVNEYFTYATEAKAATLNVARSHTNTVKGVLSEVEPLSVLSDNMLAKREEVGTLTENYQEVVDDLRQVMEMYNDKVKTVAADVERYVADCGRSVQPNVPTGQTPRVARGQIQRQGGAGVPPREVLMRRFDEKRPPSAERQDKENDPNVSNCSATGESFLNGPAHLEILPQTTSTPQTSKPSTPKAQPQCVPFIIDLTQDDSDTEIPPEKPKPEPEPEKKRRERPSSAPVFGSDGKIYFADEVYMEGPTANSRSAPDLKGLGKKKDPNESWISTYSFTDSSGSSIVILDDAKLPPRSGVEIPPFCRCPDGYPIEYCQCVRKHFRGLEAKGLSRLPGLPDVHDLAEAGPSGTQRPIPQTVRRRWIRVGRKSKAKMVQQQWDPRPLPARYRVMRESRPKLEPVEGGDQTDMAKVVATLLAHEARDPRRKGQKRKMARAEDENELERFRNKRKSEDGQAETVDKKQKKNTPNGNSEDSFHSATERFL